MRLKDEVLRLLSLKNRREEVFTQVVEATREKLFRTVRRMVERDSVAEEILQESYLALWDRSGKAAPENPEAWLVRTCVNRAIDHLRRREVRKEMAFEEELTGFQGNGIHDDAPGSWEVEAMLNRALRRLGPRERVAFILRRIEGYSYEEIARMTGVAAATARNQVMNAGKKVGEMLRAGGIEP